MGRAVLVIAAIVDLGLAVLMVAVSGFVFGAGPESMHGDLVIAALWTGMLVGSIAAPIAGFVLHARKKAGLAILIAWLPPVVALIAISIPPHY